MAKLGVNVASIKDPKIEPPTSQVSGSLPSAGNENPFSRPELVVLNLVRTSAQDYIALKTQLLAMAKEEGKNRVSSLLNGHPSSGSLINLRDAA